MIQSFKEFILSSPPQRDYLIDQLIGSDSGYGIIAGRTGLGKTNLILNLGYWLALGEPFFGLSTKRSKVCYLPFEGSDENLKERCEKILFRGPNYDIPEDDWYQIGRIDSLVLLERNNRSRFREMIRPFDIILLDPIKWMVGGNYTKPDVAAQFTRALVEILHDEGKVAIFSMQIRKRDPRVKVEPGDLFGLKGAADYVEDAAFVLLLERSELRGRNITAHLKDRYLTLHFAKHREATRDLDSVELFYDYDHCNFQVM